MNTKMFVVISMITLILAGCGVTQTRGGGSSSSSATTLTITGTLAGGTHAHHSILDTFFAFFQPRAEALVQNDIFAVVLFSDDGGLWSATVDNGSFSLTNIPVSGTLPSGLLFVGTSDSFKGYLQLPNGMNVIPLPGLTGYTLDLKTLNSIGPLVTSDVTTLMNSAFTLTVDQEAAMKHLEGLLASVVKDPDKDQNGKIDVLESKYWRLGIMYNLGRVSGPWGSELHFDTENATTFTTSITYPVTLTGHKLMFMAKDSGVSGVTTVTFDRPSGVDIQSGSDTVSCFDGGGKIFFSEMVTSPIVPVSGTYNVKYVQGSGQLKTNGADYLMPDQSQANQRLVIIEPKVHLKPDRTLDYLDITYHYSGTGAVIDPKTILRQFEVQISGTGNVKQSPPPSQRYRLYNSGQLPVTTTRYAIDLNGLSWDNVGTITMAYNDNYGCHYTVSFENVNCPLE